MYKTFIGNYQDSNTTTKIYKVGIRKYLVVDPRLQEIQKKLPEITQLIPTFDWIGSKLQRIDALGGDKSIELNKVRSAIKIVDGEPVEFDYTYLELLQEQQSLVDELNALEVEFSPLYAIHVEEQIAFDADKKNGLLDITKKELTQYKSVLEARVVKLQEDLDENFGVGKYKAVIE